jgi:MFS family permease
LLGFSVAASVISSVATGRLMARVGVGTLVPVGTLLVAAALGEEAVAPSLWVFAIGSVLFGLGFGALGSAINAHAASHFGARDINWVHAGYGLGPVAERIGAQPVLGGAVVGVAIGAAVMWVPGPRFVAVVAMMALGLAAAPIFPLLTLITARRLGPANATSRTVSLQVAASAIGAAALPAGIGVAIGLFSAEALAPLLFVLALAMGCAYAYISTLAKHSPP